MPALNPFKGLPVTGPDVTETTSGRAALPYTHYVPRSLKRHQGPTGRYRYTHLVAPRSDVTIHGREITC